MREQLRRKTLKIAAYSLLLLLIYVLQTARGTSLTLFGVSLDVMPYFIVSVAFFQGPYVAGGMGFAAGLLMTSSTPFIEGLMAMYLALAGVLCGVFCEKYLRRFLPAALLCGGFFVALKSVIAYLFYYALAYGVSLQYGGVMLGVELLLSLPFGVPVYYLVRWLDRHFMEDVEE